MRVRYQHIRVTVRCSKPRRAARNSNNKYESPYLCFQYGFTHSRASRASSVEARPESRVQSAETRVQRLAFSRNEMKQNREPNSAPDRRLGLGLQVSPHNTLTTLNTHTCSQEKCRPACAHGAAPGPAGPPRQLATAHEAPRPYPPLGCPSRLAAAPRSRRRSARLPPAGRARRLKLPSLSRSSAELAELAELAEDGEGPREALRGAEAGDAHEAGHGEEKPRHLRDHRLGEG